MFSVGQDNEVQNALLAASFEKMATAVLVTDLVGEIVLANAQACSLLELSSEALVGNPIDEVVGIWDARLEQALSVPVGHVADLGLSLVRRDMVLRHAEQGRSKGLSVTLEPLRNAKQAVIGVMVQFDLKSTTSEQSAPSENAALTQSFYVRAGGRYVRVFFRELLWVEAMENYVQLHTTRDKFVVHATLKSMVDLLSDKGYQRIHRSFIVRRDEIERIEENQVVVHGSALPIGKSYRTELLDSLMLI